MLKRFRNIKIKEGLIISIAATFVSFCALGITLYQTRILKQQLYASVWPRLEMNHTWNNVKNTYLLNIENNGVGPAIIKEVRIEYKNQVFNDFGDLAIAVAIDNQLADEDSYWDKSDLLPETVIPQQKQKQLLFIGEKEHFDAFIKALKNINVTIVYESLYGDAWQITYPRISHKKMK
ncbi:MAG: hypothetical protein ABIO60_01820 [Aquaticitalea sp.]